jgi:hypothetical protein
MIMPCYGLIQAHPGPLLTLGSFNVLRCQQPRLYGNVYPRLQSFPVRDRRSVRGRRSNCGVHRLSEVSRGDHIACYRTVTVMR